MRTPSVLWLAAALIFSACSVPLQHDLSEEDANEIYVLLQSASIEASKEKTGEGKETKYVINVPKPDVATAAQLLKDNSLPRPVANGLAVFKQTKGMIPTQTEERAMFIEALGGEASNALNRIPGVLEARVIVMIPEVTDLTQPELKPKPSASVLIKYILGDGKPPVSVIDIQEFVARSVPELVKENVKVLMIEAKSSSRTKEDLELLMTEHLGVRLEKKSVGTFRTWIAVPTLLFLGVTGVLAFLMVRKPAAKNGNGPGRRTKTTPPPE
jgi:type III secretion protein J